MNKKYEYKFNKKTEMHLYNSETEKKYKYYINNIKMKWDQLGFLKSLLK